MPDRPDPRRRIVADLARDRRDWFHLGDVRNEVVGEQPSADDGQPTTRTTADVYIFDSIGGWGVGADDFVRDVAGLDVAHLDVHVNSPGGSAWEGAAIANVLRQHRADVTVWVDGIAASAASVIAMAGDEVVMSLGSQMMIHDASTLTYGNAAQLRKDIEMLEAGSNSLAATYAAKAGGTTADWRAVMQAETWYTAEEAVAAGLADRVATDADKGSSSGEQIVPGSSSSYWDMWDSLADADRHSEVVRALYAHAGRDDAPPPRIPAGAGVRSQTPAATAGGFTPSQEDDDMSHLTEGLRQRLGITAENADEGTILAALDEALAERATEEPPKAALPEGAVAVDRAVFEQLRADAAAGREAREEQQANRREQLVSAAIRDGRIAPASKAAWLTALKTDPDGEKNLAGLSAGLIPVEELGRASNDADTDRMGDVVTDEDLEGLAALIGLPKEALQ